MEWIVENKELAEKGLVVVDLAKLEKAVLDEVNRMWDDEQDQAIGLAWGFGMVIPVDNTVFNKRRDWLVCEGIPSWLDKMILEDLQCYNYPKKPVDAKAVLDGGK